MKPLPNLQNFFRKFPELDFGDYKLRDMMLSDKQEYFELMSNPKVYKYLSDEDIPKNLFEAEQEIRFLSGLFYRKICPFWGIIDKSTDKLIGTIGYNSWSVQNRRTEISYDLMPEYWRKGITSAGLEVALNFGFNVMAVERIEARTMLDNTPSHNILEKFNFKKEGIIRNYRVIRGEPTDIVQFSLIPDDVKNCKWRKDV